MRNRFFIALYWLILSFAWLFAMPFLLILSFKEKYKKSIFARFFLFCNPPFSHKAKVIFHGASFGEVKSFLPFAKIYDLSISTTTQTGFNEAKNIAKEARFLPFEIFIPFWLKYGKVFVVSEAELWLMSFYFAKKNGLKTILINARISDKSYKNYLRFKFYYKFLFQFVDEVFAQTPTDKERLIRLGAKNIQINGNIKSNFTPNITKNYTKPSRRIITLASTHEGEEELLLSNIGKISDMLIIAPRHPERFNKVRLIVQQYAKKHGLKYKLFSSDGFCECDILLCDTLGELINIYAISDICVLCGSFLPNIGGHNPQEPAYFSNIIISGEYYFNQKNLYSLVKNIQICKAEEILKYIQNPPQKALMAEKADLDLIIKSINQAL